MSIQAAEILVNRIRQFTHHNRARILRQRAMAGPFVGNGPRLLLVTQPERIPQSQIFPFHYYGSDLCRIYGAEIREANVWSVLGGEVPAASGATVVAFQTPFDIADADLKKLVDLLRAQNPGARMACLDWFAPTDLRNASRINPLVDIYVKKHLLRDRSLYGQPSIGDTNLTDYYNRRYGIDETERCFALPPGFLNKLVLGPTFATGPLILPSLLGKMPRNSRPIDVHARFATGGTPWYTGMRSECEAALDRLAGLTIRRGEGIPLSRFMAELTQSKICFSPFGYGEVCWRDFESIAAGAVLLKQDMSHIQTEPDIFIPWETYVPLRWDLDDFQDIVHRVVSDATLRQRIADNAFNLLHDWVQSDRFARVTAPLFESREEFG